jgi:hypothetical protein
MLIYWQAGGSCARIKHHGIFVAMTAAGGSDPDVHIPQGRHIREWGKQESTGKLLIRVEL